MTTFEGVSVDQIARFWSHVDRDGPVCEHLGTRCWDWTAALMNQGYGHFGLTSRDIRRAHRFSYELERGKIPEGFVIDHLCFRPRCVNPGHLEAVTRKVNNERRRGPNKNSRSGVRGVWWDSRRSRWVAEVGSAKCGKRRGRFSTLSEAEEAAIKWRNELFTREETNES